MKKISALLTLLLVLFIVVNRQRVFLRDPLATVTRDDTKQSNVEVLINYSNDVLLEDASEGRQKVYLVQNWNRLAAVPSAPLVCLRNLACMTNADQPSATAIVPGGRGSRPPFEGVTMTNREVEFVDEDGSLVKVMLR